MWIEIKKQTGERTFYELLVNSDYISSISKNTKKRCIEIHFIAASNHVRTERIPFYDTKEFNGFYNNLKKMLIKKTDNKKGEKNE